ncbi:expressed unknown protein [Seminavis robusta]|uniref:Uncharacterized protein n=1 Tax=Seminavis robusta TaxID=568900 RepID=A0A9N8DJW0_9STRA|nr:expressed unknown protein [Seminavis robusta]|eukprot:Sro121_g058840.1 n/a (110) ;mRNA; r:44852-45181
MASHNNDSCNPIGNEATPLVGCLFGSGGDVSLSSTGGTGTGNRSPAELRSALSSILNEAMELIDITLFDDEEDNQDDTFAGMHVPSLSKPPTGTNSGAAPGKQQGPPSQ